MCEPATIAMMTTMAVLSVGSAAVSIKSQNDQVEAASESAASAATADYAAIADANSQVNTQATAEALKLKRQALIERGRLNAGRTDFFGNSPLRELLNNRLKEAEAMGTLGYNQANVLAQNTREAGKIFATATSRANEARASRINNLAAGLQIANAGVQGGVQGYEIGGSIFKPKKRTS